MTDTDRTQSPTFGTAVTSIGPTYQAANPVASCQTTTTTPPPASGSRMVTTTQKEGTLVLCYTPIEIMEARIPTS
jgi:hypothetical protein